MLLCFPCIVICEVKEKGQTNSRVRVKNDQISFHENYFSWIFPSLFLLVLEATLKSSLTEKRALLLLRTTTPLSK